MLLILFPFLWEHVADEHIGFGYGSIVTPLTDKVRFLRLLAFYEIPTCR